MNRCSDSLSWLPLMAGPHSSYVPSCSSRGPHLKAVMCHLSSGPSPTGTQCGQWPVTSSGSSHGMAPSGGVLYSPVRRSFLASYRLNRMPLLTMQAVPSHLRVQRTPGSTTHSHPGVILSMMVNEPFPWNSRSNRHGIFFTWTPLSDSRGPDAGPLPRSRLEW